jgi:hypothetical protein
MFQHSPTDFKITCETPEVARLKASVCLLPLVSECTTLGCLRGKHEVITWIELFGREVMDLSKVFTMQPHEQSLIL